MKICIVEDEAPAQRKIQKLIHEVDPKIEIVGVCENIEETVEWISENDPPDLFLMDIRLNDGLSFEIFEKVEIKSPVIFTTAYDEFVLHSLKTNGIDYLLKPIQKEAFVQSLEKYKNFKSFYNRIIKNDFVNSLKDIGFNHQEYKERFLSELGEKIVSIETKDISYFFIQDTFVYAMSKENKKYLINQNLDEIEQKLDPKHFFRLNRQYITSYQGVEKVIKFIKSKLIIELNPPASEQIIVSASRSAKLKEWLGR